MAIAPPIALGAPPTNKAALRYNLLNAAVGPLDIPDGGRLADLSYTVPWCGPGGVAYEPSCEPIVKIPEVGLDLTEGIAFVAERGFQCNALGLKESQVEQLMRDRLEVSEAGLVERAVAARFAASTPVDLGTSVTIVDAVSALETYAYTTQGYMLTAILHMPIGAFAHLADASQFTRESGTGVWRAPLGSIIAPNAGLTTTAYVTGLMVVWRSAQPFIPTAAEAFDRTDNRYKMIGQRDYIVAWECLTAVTELGVLA